MYTLSFGKISAVWYSGTLNSKNKGLFSIRHCTIKLIRVEEILPYPYELTFKSPFLSKANFMFSVLFKLL